jgi:preprotein translocase subunit SecG
MYILVACLHILVSIFLILVVLLQSGKGGMGAAFGGASQTVFGARGAGSLLGKLTAISAALFMTTSLTLAFLSTARDKSLKQAAERMEERAKARAIKTTKHTKAPTGLMSSEDAGAGEAPAPAPHSAAPADAGGAEGAN